MPDPLTMAVTQPGPATLPRVGSQPSSSRLRLGMTRVKTFMRAHPEVVVAILGAWIARAVFWQMTHRMFEDGLITITHARNASEGLGLVPHLGEGHVQGFTSAISVLVPLLGELVHPSGGGFVVIRLASMLAAGVAIVVAHLIGRELGLSRWAMIFPFAYLAFDQNQIFYGMSGMETEMATAILLTSAYLVMTERLLLSGLLFGLCILARPDFILWLVPAFAYLAYRRRDALHSLLPTIGIGLATIAPWFIFTTAYYGSPLPQTIGAKLDRYFNLPTFSAGPGAWISYAWDQLQASGTSIWHGFAPFLEDGLILKGPVSSWILGDVAFIVMALALAGAWHLRRTTKAWPLIAYVIIFLAYRVLVLPPGYYEWYEGPFMAFVVLLVAAGLTASRIWIGPRFSLVTGIVLALAFAVHMPFTFPLEARVQNDVENKVRKQVGLWLRAHVPPGQSVTSESAGYISWYGRVKLYDYPGLTSPTAYDALKSLGRNRNNMTELIAAVHPDWIVFRPYEYEAFQGLVPKVAAQYRVVQEFKAPPVALLRWGTQYINIDTDFLVLHRVVSAGVSSS
jgi:hypothetical protein